MSSWWNTRGRPRALCKLHSTLLTETVNVKEKLTLYRDKMKGALMARPHPSEAPICENINSFERRELKLNLPLEDSWWEMGQYPEVRLHLKLPEVSSDAHIAQIFQTWTVKDSMDCGVLDQGPREFMRLVTVSQGLSPNKKATGCHWMKFYRWNLNAGT